ncbi:tRNA epoxyqueuosine(34) reductase QueG [Arenibaculum sp.]|uniref:tRNA epoxyqueuosine(34) reductase QueG n=1 Tax=Arenibaculum sp. TaxID=2865862 RepID=UPI002E12B58A|nr:tRNA epoxyqueuosine(34) reductase QueG [Arenibaculum sp.]
MAEADPGTREAIRDRALALGFDAVGFAPAALGTQARERLGEFLAGGHHGDMGWMEAKADRRGDPRVLWPDARTVIALGLSYAPHEDPRRLLDHPDRGVVSVYARGRDYHDVVKSRLKALARWVHEAYDAEVKVFVDTAPVMEKPLAQQAGLGWQGKHTNLVSRAHGSWLFLGEVYTTLELPPDAPGGDRCGSCRRCLDACPTAAFPAPYRLDARRCISYLTIEHQGPIPEELRPLMGNRIYGCDDCLAACPWNKFARRTREAAFLPRAELTAPRLVDLAQLDDASFRQVFSGSPIKRIGRDRFVRNVLIALGNTGDPAQSGAVERLLDDGSELVRDAASWALARLRSRPR